MTTQQAAVFTFQKLTEAGAFSPHTDPYETGNAYDTPHERVVKLRSELDQLNRTIQDCVERKDRIIQQLGELERE